MTLRQKLLQFLYVLFVGFTFLVVIVWVQWRFSPPKEIKSTEEVIKDYLARNAELAKSECKGDSDNSSLWGNPTCRLKLTPRTMILKFMTREEFDKLDRNLDPKYRVMGFAYPYRTPCEIVLPLDDETEISSTPNEGKAQWKGFNINQTLAHEILHCYIGNWHPSVDMMKLAEREGQIKWHNAYYADPGNFHYHIKQLDYQAFELDHLPQYARIVTNSMLAVSTR